MSIVYSKKSRRQFLVGTGQVTLTLPLLSSLLPKEAMAAASKPDPRMVFFTFGHAQPKDKWIDPNLAQTAVGSDGAKEALLNTLGKQISPCMTNSVYASLLSKGAISVVRGFDNMIWTVGHGSHAISGSSERVDVWNPLPFPSIDTVFEASPTLYPSATTSNMVRKVVRCDNGEQTYSYKFSGSEIVAVPGYGDPVAMFDDLFSGIVSSGQPQTVDNSGVTKRNILNNVFASFQSVKNSRKISSADKIRLDEHMALITDLQKKYAASTITIPISNACVKPTRPVAKNYYGDYLTQNKLYLSLLAMAIKCGLTKVGMINFAGHSEYGIPGMPVGVGMHNSIFHNSEGKYTDAQINDYYVTWMKWHMDTIASEYLAQLDVEESGTGRTYLDNMLSVVLAEGGTDVGPGTHGNTDIQHIQFGTMGGFFKGNRLTYIPPKITNYYGNLLPYRMPVNSLLLTYLDAMKIPPSEYINIGKIGKGFGIYKGGSAGDQSTGDYEKYWSHRFYSNVSEIIA